MTTHQTFPEPTKTEIARLEAFAADKKAPPPPYEAVDDVRVTGEALATVRWQGRQWAVTAYGIEARDGTYCIDGRRLWEGETEHGWVRHMSEKNWVDLEDFAVALAFARRLFR